MINCTQFKKRLNDFIYDDISKTKKDEMLEHLNSCEECRKAYKEELSIDDDFKKCINLSDNSFKSQGNAILQKIDKKRYRGFSKRIFYCFRRNAISSGVIAALLVIFIVSGIYIHNNFNTIFNVSRGNEEKKNPTTNVEQNITKTVLPIHSKTGNAKIDNVVNLISKKPLGICPWRIIYSRDGKVIFYQYCAVLSYDYDGENGKYIDAIDLEEYGEAFMQGSQVTTFSPSPNGNFLVMGNQFIEMDVLNYPGLNFNINFFKLGKNFTKTIKDNKSYDLNMADIKDSWSPSEKYYVFGNKKKGTIGVIEVCSDRKDVNYRVINFKEGNIQDILISDNGDILVSSNRGNFILEKSYYDTPKKFDFNGELVCFNNNDIVYYTNGTIYKYEGKSSTPLKLIGDEFTLKSKRDGHAIFSNTKSIVVYGYDNTVYKYDISYEKDDIISLSPNLKSCFIYKLGREPMIITSDGKKILLKKQIPNAWECKWLDNNSLVQIVEKKNPKTIGDFEIVKYDIPIE